MEYGIPTTYRGLNFRSRLEATWAAFFDLVKWEWKYEPFDLKGYIPDFLLVRPPNWEMLVEVKSAIGMEALAQHAPKIEASGWQGDYAVVGPGPLTCHCGNAPEGHGAFGFSPRSHLCWGAFSRHVLDELWFKAQNATQWRG